VKKYVVLFLIVFALVALFLFPPFSSVAHAQRPLPPNNHARGLVYDGLERDDAECKGNLAVRGRGRGKARCTHGPDQAPPGFDVKKKVEPVHAYAKGGNGGSQTSPTTSTGIKCDGDGVSGKRVQVLYARASDVPSSYATYAASFQQWTAGMDALFNQSAAKTSGTRNVRFVHDANCSAVIPEVVLSPAGDDNFANTINELEAMGYNRPDRKYVIFMDARVYCGIGLIAYDDQPGSTNANNNGDTFGRIDAGCWSDVIPAHELMHQLGGVQLSAPHSSGESHCFDGYDNMCRPTNGTQLQIVCTSTDAGSLFDCNNDDYYHTNPPRGSYLATHWNTANNQFLIAPSGGGAGKKR
jgi:hypothetical protein